MIGRRLGHYEIVEKLGEGGMGAVYRARDTTLCRDVALKLLPEFVAGDSEKIARLEREARLLASLSHPNIATLHGLEESNGQKFLGYSQRLSRRRFASLGERYGIRNIRVFGSLARGEANPESDVDLLVE